MIAMRAYTHGSSRTTERSTHRADDLLGAVVPRRVWEMPKESKKSDLSNVVPFSLHLKTTGRDNSKTRLFLVCNHETRPCPFLAAFDIRLLRRQWLPLVFGSFAAHASLVVWFMLAPPPRASIGMEVIAVEMVLGAQKEAGTATTPGKAMNESAPSPDLGKPDADRTELAARQEVAKDFKPQMQSTPPPEPQPEPELAVDPDKTPVFQTSKDRPKEAEKKSLKEKGQAKRQRIAAPSQASIAANSVGVGRSDPDTNYRGLVIAHLSRHKQFPGEAQRRGDTGIATVTFTIGASGAVNSVSLARSSGSDSLDREALAMVRRASPFPAPPSGQTMAFTAPINFNLR